MTVYIGIIISILMFQALIKDKKLYIISIAAILFLVLACRDITVGADLDNYYPGYKFISSLSFSDIIARFRFFNVAKLVYPYSYEGGWMVINWISSKCGLDFHQFLILHAFVCIYSVSRLIYKYSKQPWLSFIVFVCFGCYEYMFGILRQTLAMAIVLLALPGYLQGKKWQAFVACVFAFTIHRAAILYFALFVISNIKITKKILDIYIRTCLICTFASPVLYEYIIRPLMVVFHKGYVGDGFQFNNLIVVMFAFAFFIGYFIDIREFENPQMNLITWGYMLAFPVEIAGLCNANIARAVQLFIVFLCFLLPNTIEAYQVLSTQIKLKTLALLLLVSFWVVRLANSPISNYRLY